LEDGECVGQDFSFLVELLAYMTEIEWIGPASLGFTSFIVERNFQFHVVRVFFPIDWGSLMTSNNVMVYLVSDLA
jgi:hypothetical protein